ncbi:hypothetical protein L1049_008062 [Liquidambar formosana]|uniref:Uncharacterized protein n=1 Tax=Liquidambar formosana TaxID=63359 RepID=A0AAP0X4B6_LIQFO
MGGETVAESWFSSLWRTSRKSAPEPEKAIIGVLAFEVTSLMSKLVNLWHSLSDKEVARLTEEIVKSLGVRKLVSDDDDFLMDLVLDEIFENLGSVARSVARLGRRCVDPIYHRFEQFCDDPIENVVEWYGWEYRGKKMERKVKKMERFIGATAQLYQEQDVLAELEQTLRRMQSSANIDRVKLFEFQQKVMCQRQGVRNLREMSPWNRTYDYTVRLLARSIFTILERIKHVFEISQKASVERKSDSEHLYTDRLLRSHSFSSLMQSSVHPSESKPCGFYSGPLGRPISKTGLVSDRNGTSIKQLQPQHQSSILRGKNLHSKSKRLTHIGPFKGCMMGGSDSPILQSCKPTVGGSMRSSGLHSKIIDKLEDTNMVSRSNSNRICNKLYLFNSKCRLSSALPSTLGDAALALHYANIIILIEKLASSPYLIGLDARDDLYNMLPTTVRKVLRARLKLYAKTLASSVYDAALAMEWSLALARILEWLSPLAHNMIRWQSERNFEKQDMDSGTNVLLVQTLYFADQAKTEAAITELLMGLNYICRFGRELNEKALLESANNNAYVDCMPQRDSNTYNL